MFLLFFRLPANVTVNATEAVRTGSAEGIGIKSLMMKTICLQVQVSRERDKIHLKGEVIMEAPSEELTLELLTEVRFNKF